jgi:hypothetical protein
LLLRRFAPYAIAVVAIAMVLRRYPPGEIARELQRGDALPLIPLAAVMVITSIFLVGSADWLVMRGCSSEPSYGRALRGKAGAAVLNVVAYSAHIGGYGLWIARVSGMRATLAGGVVLYILASELAAICILVTMSVASAEVAVGPILRYGAPIVGGVLVLLMLIAPFGVVPLARLPRVFRPWRLISQGRALLQLATRVVHLGSLTLYAWAGANLFGLPVPLGAMFIYFPIVLLVGSLPVNVAGFGAVQGAWLLLVPWATGGGEQVLAFSLLWQLLAAAGIVLRGLPFVRRVVAEIDEGKSRRLVEAAADGSDAEVGVPLGRGG